jgi:type I restriction enzyme S subunit
MKKTVKIGEICDILNGYAFKSDKYVEEGIRIIRIANVQKGYLEDSTPQYYPLDTAMELSKYMLAENDLLMSLTGNVGRVALLTAEMLPAALNQRVACLRIKDYSLLRKDFLYQLLNSDYFEAQCILASKGIAQKNLSTEWLKEYEIPLFTQEEQIAISKELMSIDSLITARREQLAKLDELVKSRFIELFENTNHPRVALIDLIKDGAGLSYGIVQPGDDGTGDMGVLRPVDMVDGRISTASIKYINRSIGEGFRKTELTGDELLITVRGTTGITALTDSRFRGMNVTRGIAVIRYDRNKIDPVYLNAYLNTQESQQYIQEHTRGATLQQINLSDLRIQEIMLPPMDQQRQLAAFVEQTDKSKLCGEMEVAA